MCVRMAYDVTKHTFRVQGSGLRFEGLGFGVQFLGVCVEKRVCVCVIPGGVTKHTLVAEFRVGS